MIFAMAASENRDGPVRDLIQRAARDYANLSLGFDDWMLLVPAPQKQNS